MERRSVVRILPLAAMGIAGMGTSAAALKEEIRPLCFQYLERVRDNLEKIRNTELDKLLEASYRLAYTYKNGGTCYNNWDMGHAVDHDTFANRPGDPSICVNGFPQDEVKRGDTVLVSRPASPFTRDYMKEGVFLIGEASPWTAETPDAHLLNATNRKLKYRDACEIWINNYITTQGAIMWLPGEKVPMGCVSGVLGMMTFWMMNVDAARILARDGVSLDVRGDEPEIDPDSKNDYLNLSIFESVNKPLGSVYFNEAMKQLKNIEAELGVINSIADMAVETILSGGRILNYSRYQNSLCHESLFRRGGLLLNKGIYAGDNGPIFSPHFPDLKIKSDDMVIMGITQPDDSVDIMVLKSLRKIGIKKIVTIGARTKNFRLPAGETVSGEADIHLGNMCDTYGLFAIPGLKRKVGPTSGLLINQMFYAVQMQIAEKIIERTGNTPRIDANVAMEGYWNKRTLDFQIISKRGY